MVALLLILLQDSIYTLPACCITVDVCYILLRFFFQHLSVLRVQGVN